MARVENKCDSPMLRGNFGPIEDELDVATSNSSSIGPKFPLSIGLSHLFSTRAMISILLTNPMSG